MRSPCARWFVFCWPFYRWPVFCHPVLGLVGLTLLGGVQMLTAPAMAQQAPAFREHPLSGPIHAVDGDTFENDLDGDGELELPRERVRLLYVDTPELGESHKGTDRVRGLQAQELLQQALGQKPLLLAIPVERSHGRYGRTLGVLISRGEDIGLKLVREGLSYFDTRFAFPAQYDRYADAEARAFEEQLGIWSDAESRSAYLQRLAQEKKTPRSDVNPHYAGTFVATQLDLDAQLDKYVRVQGQLLEVRKLRRRVIRLQLEGPPGLRPILVVAFLPISERLGVVDWYPGSQVLVEGFVRSYRDRRNIVLHYGTVLQPAAAALGDAPLVAQTSLTGLPLP